MPHDLSPSLAPPDDLFAPRHYEGVRRPLLDAETLPPWCYTSEAFYRREVERIFRKIWNFIGRSDRVPEPGDFFTLEFAGVPLVVVRGHDGQVRAFSNSCRHRGSIVAEGEGNCRAFKCPYHSWAYGLDGALLGAPDMDATRGFDPRTHGLLPVRLETWGGFMFVNFDPAAESLAGYLGDLPRTLAPYAFDDMVCTRRVTYEVGCNWKTFVENAKEAYHIGTVHRNTIHKYASARSSGYWVQETQGQYVSTFAKHEGSMALLQGDAGFPKLASLTPETAAGTTAPLVYPSTYLGCTIDSAWYLEVHPLGAQRMRLIHGAMFPRAVLDRPDFQALAANYYKRWDITIEEDNVACDLQQRGLNSPFARAGRFSHREPLVHAIDNWILDRVLDA
ncbi:MAG: aromatic ring-hydroxylating dioxygenase subunit alpha [Alphaproteobacteria bacterium]|nr:aromatic ring-hydroxylating dioxygenase subunit alpha [Alphaproteobacteria bacterium]